MGYCDSKVLEKNWLHWLLSSTVPDLECYRELGLLWSKIGEEDQTDISDPLYPIKSHCIALSIPVFFTSRDGKSSKFGVAQDGSKVNLPLLDELSLLSDSRLHRLEGNLFAQQDEVWVDLEEKGYTKELPTERTWHAVLEDVNKMCQGIATKFKQPTEEEQMELAHEAFLQIMKKLASYKLVFTPNRAPVFNLLTTAIYRCMYSIMNRRKNQRQGLQQYMKDVQAGAVPKYKHKLRQPIRS